MHKAADIENLSPQGGTAPLTKNLHVLCSVSKLSILFLKLYIIYSKLSNELKNGIEILAGQKLFKLWIKKSKCCLDQ